MARTTMGMCFTAALICLAFTPLGCDGEAGSFRIQFDWPEGQAPAGADSFYAWATLEHWSDGTATTAVTLSEAGPVQLGGGALAFANLSYGAQRVVVVRIRGSQSEDDTILFYGVSEAFTLKRGARHAVSLPVTLRPGPGIADDGTILDPQIALSHPDAAPDAGDRVPAANVGLSFQVVNADAVTVANDPAFSLGAHTLPVTQLTTLGPDRYAWPEAWDLNEGFMSTLGDGARSVYLRYENEFGLRSRVYQQSAFLDTSPPVLELELNGQFFLADSTIRITVNVNEELAAGEPQVQVSGSGFDQTLVDPEVQGFSHIYLLAGESIGLDGSFTVSATARDRVGHPAGPLARTFTLDGLRPHLTATPVIVAPAVHTDGAHWAAAGTTVSMSLPTTEALDPDLSRITLGTAELTYDAQTGLWERTLDGSEGSGVKALRGEMVDPAGNPTDLAADLADLGLTAPEVHFDFDPPRLTGASIMRQPFFAPAQDLDKGELWACATDPITGQAVTVTLFVYADEELGGTPTISASNGTDTIPLPLSDQGQALEATLDMATAAPADGRYTFELSWQDWLGNARVTTIASPVLIVDNQPPAADILDMGAVVYHRLPWGTEANGCNRAFSISADPGAIDPAAAERLTVITSLGQSVQPGDQIGTGPVQPDGSFLLSDLPAGDRPDLSVSLIARSGARSAPLPVRQVRWTASMCHKRLGSTVENPHVFEAATWNLGALQWADTSEVAVPQDGSSIVPEPVTSAGASGQFTPFLTDTPAADYGLAMAYDRARGVTVLFSGHNFSGETWEWNGVNWALRTPIDPEQDGDPAPRWRHRLAYDEARQVTVLSGGAPGSDETWEWDGLSWALRVPDDPENDGDPGDRQLHALAYDSKRGVTVLFGHITSNDQTWEWDGTSWALRTPDDPEGDGDPAGRSDAAMAYDPLRGVSVLFGGRVSGVIDGETWEWDGISWRRASTTGPAPRWLHTMAFDEALGMVILFGGDSTDDLSDGYMGDVWAWDGADWTLQAAAGADTPDPRRAHGMTHDPLRKRTVILGGYNGSASGQLDYDDTWEFDSQDASWHPAGPRDDALAAHPNRQLFAAAFDEARQRVVVFGGTSSPTAVDGDLDEVWEWNGQGWVLRYECPLAPCSGPEARMKSALADVAGDGVLLFGGDSTTSNHLADTWLWDGAGWTELTAGPGDPPGRSRLALAHDRGRDKVILFGGDPDGGVIGSADTWEWDGLSQTWSDLSPAVGNPSPRMDHAMAYDPIRGETVLFGGRSSGSNKGDTWIWNGATWTAPAIPDPEGDGDPPARYKHRMAWDPDRQAIVLFGGVDANPLADVWEWNGTSWAQRTLADPRGDGRPSARSGHGLSHDGQRLLAFWGFDEILRGDLWFLTDGVDRTGGMPAGSAGLGPVHVFRPRFAAAQAGAGATLNRVELLWAAGGSGVSPLDGSVHDGAALLVWDGGWQAIAQPAASNLVPWDAPAALTATLTDPDQLARLAADSDGVLHLAVQPIETVGTPQEPARLQSETVEVTVQYTRGP